MDTSKVIVLTIKGGILSQSCIYPVFGYIYLKSVRVEVTKTNSIKHPPKKRQPTRKERKDFATGHRLLCGPTSPYIT